MKINNRVKRPEILSPAGSMEAMKAAVAAGCDAVYMGGLRFGARAYAQNPEGEDMVRVLDYLHLHGRKLYLTVNTLIKDSELVSLAKDVGALYEAGLDAAIVQDVGAMRYLHHCYPDLPLHASTQMTLTMAQGVSDLSRYGVNRLVPARELSIDELRAMRKDTDLEIEVFVHGALCYSYSGQCLMSSMIGGRSGNRGRCAQPCRMVYSLQDAEHKTRERSYWMSLKDLCSLDQIGNLVDIGVDSFKIEGRMKKPEYVALTTELYRKYREYACDMGSVKFNEWISGNPKEYQDDRRDLMDLYNRGSFTKGYLMGQKKDMLSGKRPNHNGVLVGEMTDLSGIRATILLGESIHSQDVLEFRNDREEAVYEYTTGEDIPAGCLAKTNTKKDCGVRPGMKVYRTRNGSLIKRIQNDFCENNAKILLRGEIEACVGKPIKGIVSGDSDTSVTYRGDTIEPAMNRSLSEDELRKQLSKLGTTDYRWDELQVKVEAGGFLSVGQIKKFRRELLARYEEACIDACHRTKEGTLENQKDAAITGEDNPVEKQKMEWVVQLACEEQLNTALHMEWIHSIYLDTDAWGIESLGEAILKSSEAGKKVYLMLPAIFRKRNWDRYTEWYSKQLPESVKKCLSGFVIRNLEELAWAKQQRMQGHELRANANLYIMNREARAFYIEQGIQRYTACLEASKQEWEQIGVGDCDVIVYGYQPVMQTEGCAIRELSGTCGQKKKKVELLDASNRKFPVVSHCESCYSSVYYPDPFSLHMHAEEVLALVPAALRMDFTWESAEQMEAILTTWHAAFTGEERPVEEGVFYTKGHYNRPLM